MPQTAIWPGSSSFASGQTPFGIYDSDAQFSGSGVNSVDKFADWCAKRLGYPIMDVEMNLVLFMQFMKKRLQNTQHK